MDTIHSGTFAGHLQALSEENLNLLRAWLNAYFSEMPHAKIVFRMKHDIKLMEPIDRLIGSMCEKQELQPRQVCEIFREKFGLFSEA